MFGVNARVGLTSTSLPQDIISCLQSEQDLITILQQQETDADEPETEAEADVNEPEREPPKAEMNESEQEPEPLSQHQTNLDQLHNSISSPRLAESESQRQQAERMVKRSRTELVAGEIGDNIALPIPLVDRGRGDPRNILGVIVSRSMNDQYRVATKSGVLKESYSRNQFDICPERLLKESDINNDIEISLLEAVIKSSISGG
ncbi:uncharacterized protein [Palaemon carinicauda]|uniref:uncharacterized protein n=1 Tax=Palaemon carinicauda TaxID=392227 RepID=UPI0035B608D7